MGAREGSPDQQGQRAVANFPLSVLLPGLIVALVFGVGLIVFGSGKFGWTVVVLLLSYLLYRAGLPAELLSE